MSRFTKRNRERKRIYYMGSGQIGEVDENGHLVITPVRGYIKKFEQVYFQHGPTFAEKHNVDLGSEDERIDVDYKVRNGLPRFEDRDEGICLY